MRKYEFTGETKTINIGAEQITLHRIRATRDFGDVKTGDLGGWIEDERNLSHTGNCWINDDAAVFDNATVCGNAVVFGNATVYGTVKVWDNAKIYGNAWIYGNAQIYGCAEIAENATVGGNAKVYGNAEIGGQATVQGDAKVYGKAIFHNNALACGNAKVYGCANISGYAVIRNNAIVCGNAEVSGNAEVCKNAKIRSANHVIEPIGSRNTVTTFYLDKDNEITVKCGCFLGKVDEFLQKVTQTHGYPEIYGNAQIGDNTHASVYRAAVEVARLRMTPLTMKCETDNQLKSMDVNQNATK